MMMPIALAAKNASNKIAFDDGKVQLSYGRVLAELSKSKAAIAVDLQVGDHVAWAPRNDRDAFLTFWALQLRGCVACPISHRFPKARCREIVDRIEAKWLSDVEFDETLDPEWSVNLDLNQSATLVLSSGSTGQPKAVVHSMAAHVASAQGAVGNMPLDVGDRWLWSLPLCHVSGLSILVRCAVAGATVVGFTGDDRLTTGLLAERGVTHVSLVSTQLKQLLAEPDFPPRDLKYVLLGGSAVEPDLVQEARSRGVAVCTTYGLTEMASQVTTSAPTDDPTKSGRVLEGRELAIDATGEILVRGETLCLGYYVDGSLQSVVDDRGWFHTRDLGEMDSDRQLAVIGRIDNMFISGGENIHPETIERAMASVFEISQVVVVPRSDIKFGKRPVAFVDGKLPSNWESVLRDRLQGFEIPVEIREFPTEARGSVKPDRKMLIRLAEA